MADHAKDWRETERRLSELPDEQLRQALSEAGIRAVLPSHKKQSGSVKPPGEQGEATTRWARGDWQERISLEDLPDAQKFLDDPLKPPTVAIPQTTAPSTRPPAGSRPWRGLVVGLASTAALAGLVFVALTLVGGRGVLERPQVVARSASAVAGEGSLVPVAAGAAGDGVGAGDRAGERKDTAGPIDDAPAMAAPAGSQRLHDVARLQQEDRANLQALERKAKGGDFLAMLHLARAHLERGDADAAMKWAKRAKLKRRASIEARILLGDAQLLAGYGKAAEDTWRGALARQPGNQELRERLGE